MTHAIKPTNKKRVSIVASQESIDANRMPDDLEALRFECEWGVIPSDETDKGIMDERLYLDESSAMLQDYTGKHLQSHWDDELFVLHQLGDLLFCISYSQRHEVYTLLCHTVAQVLKWEFRVVGDSPAWLNLTKLSKWQEHF